MTIDEYDQDDDAKGIGEPRVYGRVPAPDRDTIDWS